MIKLPTSASFLISEDCNLRCSYCFELNRRNKQHMKREVALKAVDYLFQNAIENQEDDKQVAITLFGGEPMLNPDVIDDIITYGYKLNQRTNINFGVMLITNGTIMNEDLVNRFKQYREKVDVGIQLSVDSIKEYNDVNRVTPDGTGSFDLVHNNISLFKEIFGGNNFYNTELRDFLHVHASLNQATLPHMYESYLFFRDEWRIPAMWFMPIDGDFWTKEDVNIYKHQLSLIKDEIIKKINETSDIRWLQDYAPLNKALDDPQPFFSNPCGAGKNYCTITASGDIYPCHQFYFSDEYKSTKLGNIWDGINESRRKLFIDYDPTNMYCTIDCQCSNYNCYRCIAEYFAKTGSILSTHYGARCAMSKIEEILVDEIRELVQNMNTRTHRDNCPYVHSQWFQEHDSVDSYFKKISKGDCL